MARSFKIWWRAFRQYRLSGMTLIERTNERSRVELHRHRCRNCGRVISTPFCPHCGQSYNQSRITGRSLLSGMFLGFSSYSSSFALTILHCLIRPGYLIKDFIFGRRVRYTDPFSTLFVVVALSLLIAYIFNPSAEEKEVQYSDVREAVDDLSTGSESEMESACLSDVLKMLDSAQLVRRVRQMSNNIDSLPSLERDSILTAARKELSISKGKDLSGRFYGTMGDGYWGKMMRSVISSVFSENSVWVQILQCFILGFVVRRLFRKTNFVRHTSAAELLIGHVYLASGTVVMDLPISIFAQTSLSTHVAAVMGLVEVAYLVFAYIQLFGLSFWKTLIKTFRAIIRSLVLAVILYIIGAIIVLAIVMLSERGAAVVSATM